MWKLNYLKFFWYYLDINYVFERKYIMWALCGFNPMPCVIFRWSPDLDFVVFVTTELDPGQCPSTLDDSFFLTTHGGKRFFNCMWVRLLPMGEAAVHRAKRLHTREDNIMPVVNRWIPWPIYVVVWYICDKLSYVRFYGFGSILVVFTDYSI